MRVASINFFASVKPTTCVSCQIWRKDCKGHGFCVGCDTKTNHCTNAEIMWVVAALFLVLPCEAWHSCAACKPLLLRKQTITIRAAAPDDDERIDIRQMPAPPAFTFQSDEPEEDDTDEEQEVEFSFESQTSKNLYGTLDGFAPGKRDSDFQEGLEEFSLSSAADDLNSAVSKASIPAGAFAIAAVALLGLVYLVVGLLFG